MKKFFKKYGLAIVTAVLGGVIIYDHFSEITSAVKNAGKWVGEKCSGSDNEDVPEEKEPEPEPEPEPEKPQNRFERRPYTGNMGNGKYNNKK